MLKDEQERPSAESLVSFQPKIIPTIEFDEEWKKEVIK